jgi:hypothetical protein
VTCGQCGERGAYWLFPAFFRAAERGQLAESRAEGQASCFFHPEKVATVACDGCGRFLCSVCDVPVGKSHLCTSCLQAKDQRSGAQWFENERLLHDSMTLTLALAVPFVFWPATVISAPYALYRSIRYFRTPSSLVSEGRWRLYVAMVASATQLLAMVAGLFYALLGS